MSKVEWFLVFMLILFCLGAVLFLTALFGVTKSENERYIKNNLVIEQNLQLEDYRVKEANLIKEIELLKEQTKEVCIPAEMSIYSEIFNGYVKLGETSFCGSNMKTSSVYGPNYDIYVASLENQVIYWRDCYLDKRDDCK